MKKTFSILALMLFFSSFLVAQEPIDLPFSGEKGIINKSWRGHWAHSQIKGSPNYRPMPFYEGTYIFFKYGKSNKIAPSVRFKKLNEIHQDSSDPPYWTTIQKYSTEGTSNAWVLDPNDKPENTSKEVKIMRKNCQKTPALGPLGRG